MRSVFFIGMMSALLLVSCESAFDMETNKESENHSEAFTATIENEPETRTFLSNYSNNDGSHSLYWSKGDAISISDGTGTAVFTTENDYQSKAVFNQSEGSISHTASQYTAFYPSTITVANMVLPAEQNYVNNNVENFPMRAVSSNKNLAFKNLCGIICLSLKSEESGAISVSSICLSADKGMSGAFTVDLNNAAVVSGNNGVVLNCADAQSLYTTYPTDFNIIVPQGDYNPLKVKICDDNGNEINLVSEDAISVKRSAITRINLTLARSSFDSSLETIPITDSIVDFTQR